MVATKRAVSGRSETAKKNQRQKVARASPSRRRRRSALRVVLVHDDARVAFGGAALAARELGAAALAVRPRARLARGVPPVFPDALRVPTAARRRVENVLIFFVRKVAGEAAALLARLHAPTLPLVRPEEVSGGDRAPQFSRGLVARPGVHPAAFQVVKRHALVVPVVQNDALGAFAAALRAERRRRTLAAARAPNGAQPVGSHAAYHSSTRAHGAAPWQQLGPA